jgi:hypothetical protein
MAKYSYPGFCYAQRENGELITFVAPVGDIKSWAGVPRKHFNYQHGFQRSLAEKRVGELRDFYALDAQNITPTSVVVAVRKGACDVRALSQKDENGNELLPTGLCEISFELKDLSQETTGQLIDDAIELVRYRLGDAASIQIESDLTAAVQVAIEAEAQDDASGTAEDTQVVDGDLADAPSSHLLHFYTELLALKEGKVQLEDEEKLREVLYSLLKPAIIVDGQHRVYGAAAYTESMKFAVNAIPDADWLEQVFQFVVINQKAKPIEPAFLHSIIATSLTDDEIGKLYKRLRKSGVDVEKAQFMNRINTDHDSPFKGMIDFEVEGSPGYLKFPGMSTLARDFRNVQKSYPGLVAENVKWTEDIHWTSHFYAFWRGVRDYFIAQDSRLWKEPSESNPNNLLKIVTLQEIQRMVLESWADARTFKLVAPDDTYQHSRSFWEGFPSQFFTDEWKKKGLQTAVGRKYLAEAIQQTRRNLDRKNWGHRRLGLFQDM